MNMEKMGEDPHLIMPLVKKRNFLVLDAPDIVNAICYVREVLEVSGLMRSYSISNITSRTLTIQEDTLGVDYIDNSNILHYRQHYPIQADNIVKV